MGSCVSQFNAWPVILFRSLLEAGEKPGGKLAIHLWAPCVCVHAQISKHSGLCLKKKIASQPPHLQHCHCCLCQIVTTVLCKGDCLDFRNPRTFPAFLRPAHKRWLCGHLPWCPFCWFAQHTQHWNPLRKIRIWRDLFLKGQSCFLWD